MNSWWLIFLLNCLVPLLMILSGRMMWRYCPSHMSELIGYRTKRSMRNIDTWTFSNEYMGKLWWKAGWVILILTILIQAPFYRAAKDVMDTVTGYLVAGQCVLLIGSIIPTEIAMKKTFHEDGSRK